MVNQVEALCQLGRALGGFLAGAATVVVYAKATGQALAWPWTKPKEITPSHVYRTSKKVR